MATLEALATTLNAQCVLLREKTESEGKVKEYLVRKETDTEDFMEVRLVATHMFHILIIDDLCQGILITVSYRFVRYTNSVISHVYKECYDTV